MKKAKSLVLAFTAATAMFGGAAMAQTAGAPPAPDVSVQAPVPAAQPQMNIQDVYNFAYNVGVQTPYPLAGRGFAQGQLPSGQHVGIEFDLTGNQYTVRTPYNLDDPASARAFQGAVNSAAAKEADLAAFSAPVYPETYVLCAPRAAIVGVGFGIYGWTPVWVPEVVVWEGFGYRGGIGYHLGFEGGRRHDVIVERERVIERHDDHRVEFHGAPPEVRHPHR